MCNWANSLVSLDLVDPRRFERLESARPPMFLADDLNKIVLERIRGGGVDGSLGSVTSRSRSITLHAFELNSRLLDGCGVGGSYVPGMLEPW